MAAINLELTRNELIDALANTTDLDIIAKMKRAYDRILKSRTQKKEWPLIGPSTYEEMEERIHQAELEFERGETIPHDVVMAETHRILVGV